MRFLLMACIISLSISAQARTLELAQVLDLGFKNSPYRYQLEGERAEGYGVATDSAKLINPEVEYEYDFDVKSSLGVSQSLRPSDLSFARYSYGKLLGRQQNIQKKQDVIRIAHYLTDEYYALYVLQERLKYLQENEKFVAKVLSALEGKLYQSDLEKAEMSLFKADAIALKNQRVEAQQIFSAQKRLFLNTLDLTKEGASDKNSDMEKISFARPKMLSLPPQKEVLSLMNSGSAYRTILLEEKKRAEKEVSIAKQDAYFPTVSPNAKYNLNHSKWSAGIGVSIPLWNRESGNRKLAKAKLMQVETKLRQLSQEEYVQLVKSTYEQAAFSAKQADDYTKVILPLYRQSLDKMQQEYLAGNVSVLLLWQAKEKVSAAQITALEATQKSVSVAEELELLIGVLLKDI